MSHNVLSFLLFMHPSLFEEVYAFLFRCFLFSISFSGIYSIVVISIFFFSSKSFRFRLVPIEEKQQMDI